ncbi:uncharacterized protein [Choristoneura fumiferana]|uniref:uncharacterized protein n=3 Tax=Choristoneura fumiferana TaxID=7141 RepID=UPI003D15A64C
MDSKSCCTKSREAGPVGDEAKKDCGKVRRVPVTDRDAGAGPSSKKGPVGFTKARGTGVKAHRTKGEKCGGAAPPKGTARPLPEGSKRGRTVPPAKGSTCVVAGKGKRVTAPSSRKAVAPPQPNPVQPNPASGEGAQTPTGTSAPSYEGWTKMSRRRKRRAKEILRALGPLEDSSSEGGTPAAPTGNPAPQKRPLATTGGPSQSARDSKRTKVAESYAEILAGERAAIVPVDFPAERVLMGHVGAIQEAVITRLLDAPDPLPQLTFGNIVGGALHVGCNNAESFAWLSSAIGEGEIAGMSLKVVYARDLPKPVKMAWKTKIVGVQDSRTLLRLLQRFNPRLHTEQWKVVDTIVAEASARRIILMDRESAEVIKEAGYCLHSGIDVSSFKLLDDAEKTLGGGGDDQSTARGKAKANPGIAGAAADGVEVNPEHAKEAPGDAKVAPGDTEASSGVAEIHSVGAQAVPGEAEVGAAVVMEVEDVGSDSGADGVRGVGGSSVTSSQISLADLRALSELYLDGPTSPASQEEPQERAADLSMPKKN